jgi:hypothetical protein
MTTFLPEFGPMGHPRDTYWGQPSYPAASQVPRGSKWEDHRIIPDTYANTG